MQIIAGKTEFNIDAKSAVAIGKFDGIHLGHKKLLRLIDAQKADGLKSVVFTFDPLPEELFSGKAILQLFTQDEKRRAFENAGVDILIEFPLTEETAAIKPEVFVRDILVKQMNAAYIAAGSDVSFGDKGRGDRFLLKSLAGELGYELELIDKVRLDGAEISSTRIREEVSAGNMEMVSRLLGNDYIISGTIEHGRHLGHTIGIPTVNVIPPDEKLLPPFGVYASVVNLYGKEYPGMTNIGRKPTVSDEEKVGAETYIYDFDANIYGKFVEVGLKRFIRPEMRFDSIDALKKQMEKDIADGRQA